MATVFGAAFVAGAVAAFGINRVLDVHLAQSRPQVECEPIFVALRTLPQGSPITVYDVALRDWPKAMLPTTALKAEDSFEGMLLRYPLREGQPLVAAQLVKDDDAGASRRMVGAPEWPERPAPAAEHWTPARPETAAAPIVEQPAVGGASDPETVAVETAVAAPIASEPHVPAPVTSEPAPSELVTHEPAAADTGASVSAVTSEPDSGAPPPTPFEAEDSGSAALVALDPNVPAGQASIPTDSAAGLDEGVTDLPPVDATVATVTDVVADLPPVQQLGNPTPAEPPATLASAAPVPLAPPVPALPATDIEMPLASITATRPQAAARESSVLAASDTATPAAPTPAAPPAAAPLRYLVVPERIALQADASFVSPQPVRGRTSQSPGREASTQPRPQPRGPATPARAGGPTPSESQRRQAAPPARQGGPGRTEAAPKATGGWLPRLGFGGFGSGAARPQPTEPAAVR